MRAQKARWVFLEWYRKSLTFLPKVFFPFGLFQNITVSCPLMHRVRAVALDWYPASNPEPRTSLRDRLDGR